MAYHRTVITTDQCLVCGVPALRHVQIYVGVADGKSMTVGDCITWTGSPFVERGGRPGSTTGRAYGVGDCSRCLSSIDYDIDVRGTWIAREA